ncbi:hypothetical protein Htur_0643 [Haloterrigena turkmenica DSM 5511]|uniref:ArsA HSP20-like domain-containing protein n=1 Tax=Haloterrigena turkmenica (strain ATCC 51198 / DSM 5511 / JCM 9101 / NCIMB 13204 / VKM B-1734 / 4k) TaxID=543526 RepID=D2RWF2_HALTV|nr:Hsp20/alpha crystallin family protein [Haloterrigena turkmenica]ADB59541.1 hypothetical protein Htur_0643 [Haloterrigena turkmenica DSM 5511]
MSEERSDENGDEDDPPPSRSDDEETDPSGFHLDAGLRPLRDLLGHLVEVTVTDSPPPSEETTDWSSVDDDSSGRSVSEPSQPVDHDTNRPRKRRRRTSPSDGYLVDTRREDGEFVVTADIPDASRDDLSIGIDPRTNELVIGVAGTALERIDPPWRSVEATKVWFNNGVLEVRLRPDGS